MPAWYTNSYWVRGQLASEDDGTLVQAAVAEQYLLGRNDFAAGVSPGSPARSFADAAQDAIERAHADAAGNSAAFRAIDAAVRDAHAQETHPEVDAYARVSSLSNSMTSLILAAERADAEEHPL